MVYEKKYFAVCINKEYICLKNNIAQLYHILGGADLGWDSSSLLSDT